MDPRKHIALFVFLATVVAAAGCARRLDATAKSVSAPATAPSHATSAAAMVGNKSKTDLTVHVIDVGQGNCVLVECPGADPILNDCGSTQTGSLSRQQIHNYINGIVQQYVTKTDPSPLTIYVSHSDEDHLNLIYNSDYGVDPDLVGTLYVSERDKDYSKNFRNWAATTAAYNAGRYYHFNGKGPYLDESPCGLAKVDVIAVNAKYGASGNTANADSIVLRVGYKHFRAIFTGDAQCVTEDLALKNVGANGVLSNLLLGSHHGADTHKSNSQAWVKATNPHLVVFSAGHNDSYAHPRCTVINRYIDDAPRLATMDSSMEVECGHGRSMWGEVDTDKGVLSTYMNDTITVTAHADDTYTLDCGNNRAHCYFATGVSAVAPAVSAHRRRPGG